MLKVETARWTGEAEQMHALVTRNTIACGSVGGPAGTTWRVWVSYVYIQAYLSPMTTYVGYRPRFAVTVSSLGYRMKVKIKLENI